MRKSMRPGLEFPWRLRVDSVDIGGACASDELSGHSKVVVMQILKVLFIPILSPCTMEPECVMTTEFNPTW